MLMMLLSWDSFIQNIVSKQFFTRRNGGITDALRSSMMRSILTVAMERNEAVRNYLMVGLTVTTRKIPKICISIGYKK